VTHKKNFNFQFDLDWSIAFFDPTYWLCKIIAFLWPWWSPPLFVSWASKAASVNI